MIRILVREQLRSQARYAAAAFALVAVATSLGTFLLVSLATTLRENQRLAVVSSGLREHHAWAPVWTHGPAADPPVGLTTDMLSRAELDGIVTQLQASGAEPQVRIGGMVWVKSEVYAHSLLATDDLPAMALEEGTPPGPGEVALAGRLADALGVPVGEEVSFTSGQAGPVTMTLKLSGILREPSNSASYGAPLVVVSLADGPALSERAGFTSGPTAEGDPTGLMEVYLAWNGPVPPSLVSRMDEQSSPSASITTQPQSLAQAALALVLLTSLVAAAAAGRSQGAARTQWVGTVRALGATRRDVVVAALVETTAVGAGAGMLGVAAGIAANVALIRRHGGTFAGDWPSVTATAVGLSLALAVTISLLLAATPAFWAARTSPAGALTPVGPADLVPSRPRVTTRNLAWACGCLAALLVVRVKAASTAHDWPRAVVTAIACAFAWCLYLLMLRLLGVILARAGRWLGTRRHQVLVAAGTGLAQHPRAAAAIATSMAAGGVVAGAAVWWWAARPGSDPQQFAGHTWPEVFDAAGITTVLTAGVMGASATVVGLAVWIATGTIAVDASVLGALGLSGRVRQVAAMAQTLIAALAGAVVGLATGTLAMAVATSVLTWWGAWSSRSFLPAWPNVLQGIVVWLGALLGLALVSAAVALAAARASDGKDPAALKRKANRAGVPT